MPRRRRWSLSPTGRLVSSTASVCAVSSWRRPRSCTGSLVLRTSPPAAGRNGAGAGQRKDMGGAVGGGCRLLRRRWPADAAQSTAVLAPRAAGCFRQRRCVDGSRGPADRRRQVRHRQCRRPGQRHGCAHCQDASPNLAGSSSTANRLLRKPPSRACVGAMVPPPLSTPASSSAMKPSASPCGRRRAGAHRADRRTATSRPGSARPRRRSADPAARGRRWRP